MEPRPFTDFFVILAISQAETKLPDLPGVPGDTVHQFSRPSVVDKGHVLEGEMTVGQLVQFVTYSGYLFGPLSWMTHLPRQVMQMMTSLNRIYDVLDEEPLLADKEDSNAAQRQSESAGFPSVYPSGRSRPEEFSPGLRHKAASRWIQRANF